VPSQGYTVNPVYSDDASEQQIVDLEVISGRNSVGNDGQVKNWQNDYFEDEYGNVHHRFEEVELEDESTPNTFNEDEYVELLLESNPKFYHAQQWAIDNLSDVELEEYNRLIDTSDLGDLHKAMDWLVEQYEQFADVPEASEPEQVEEEVEEEDLTESDKMAINAAVHSLNQTEALDYLADDWQEHVQYAEQSGDETYATVAAATASFHAGEVTAQEAIDYCMSNCNMKELARVYKHLMTQ
jgi:hypothetical protein